MEFFQAKRVRNPEISKYVGERAPNMFADHLMPKNETGNHEIETSVTAGMEVILNQDSLRITSIHRMIREVSRPLRLTEHKSKPAELKRDQL